TSRLDTGGQSWSGNVSLTCGDRLDLHELACEAEHAHPEERARRAAAAEALLHDGPRGEQVGVVARCHVDRRLHDVLQTAVRGAQGHDQVVERLAHLRGNIVAADDRAVRIERT